MDVVTIANYARPEEAHLARLRLCREDVPAFVVDEALVQMNWLFGFMLGGVRLQVAEDDIEKALAILKAEPVVAQGPNPLVTCPACGSQNAEVYFRAGAFGWMSLVFHVPLFFFTRWHRWKCLGCGTTWK